MTNLLNPKIKFQIKKHFVFIVLICCLLACKHDKILSEEYLIPENFKGFVLILFNQKAGVKSKINKNTVVYKIPRDGILCVKEGQYLVNQRNTRYYYYNEKTNSKTEICSYVSDTIFRQNKRACNSMVYNNSYGEYRESIDSEIFNYVLIIVGKETLDKKFDPSTIPDLLKKNQYKVGG
ncbi:hypothetical protein H7U22_09615 [Pedobacter sp. CCM 8938]|uniref:DUF6843 domain-containing protein n=1 Tax=Pedobacter fastidiosus TaxID=2765361 RepID=A0ABR7KRH1_9SPHI|nr:hypothetical protein [Pedobacter fastidiosus]MBC6110684.1 hypothetical protein [Pedobacter fastidiosus]